MVQASREKHFSTNAIVLTHCCMGNMEQARVLYNEMKQKPPGIYTGYASEALTTALLDGVDEALINLEKAYEERDPVLLTLKYNDVVSPALRQDKRFQSLLERINFS